MSWTKRQIVEQAYGELALAGYVFDITPEEVQAALVKLDAMMAARFEGLPYAFGLNPDNTDPDQDSGLPLTAMEAVYMHLAITIAAGKGKSLARSTLAIARAAYNSVMSMVAHDQVRQQQLRQGVPLGAGNKNRCNPFTPAPDLSPLQVDSNDALDFLGD